MATLQSHPVSVFRTHTEASATSSDSSSLPSPQLVEKSGRSSPEAFFYARDEDCALLDRTEKGKDWTRGLNPITLKRYLEALKGRKLITADIKQREEAVKPVRLIRPKQRVFSPLLTLEKPFHLYARQPNIRLQTRKSENKPFPSVSRLKRPAETLGKTVMRTEVSFEKAKLLRKAPFSSVKMTCLKPLRSLTPQIGHKGA